MILPLESTICQSLRRNKAATKAAQGREFGMGVRISRDNSYYFNILYPVSNPAAHCGPFPILSLAIKLSRSQRAIISSQKLEVCQSKTSTQLSYPCFIASNMRSYISEPPLKYGDCRICFIHPGKSDNGWILVRDQILSPQSSFKLRLCLLLIGFGLRC
jgi:hypothetical protein